jgi:transposase
MMRDKDLYRQILGIRSPWRVTDVELAMKEESVTVHVALEPDSVLHCPECGAACPGYDRRSRRWRHLDTCQFKTILAADVPRVRCAEHGVHQVAVPWAEPGSGFTALFEALVIDWLREASISAVGRRLGLSWSAIDTIMQRAVRRGLARREQESPHHLNVDETSFAKRHQYVTVVSDSATGRVLHVAQERTTESLEGYYATLDAAQKETIESVSMDMWPAFIKATLAAVPDAREKIAFDKFHVAKHLGEAVDRVRRREHRELLAVGDKTLVGTKFQWLTNPENMSREKWLSFKLLRESALKTARAWAMKETAMSLWHYVSRGWAERAWKGWLRWAAHSRQEPIRKVVAMIREHLWGILNAIVLRVHNAGAESINSRIQLVKYRARGFRNMRRFINAIYFHLGGLDLYPAGAPSRFTHTDR